MFLPVIQPPRAKISETCHFQLFVIVISKMTFDYGFTLKNLTLTFWPILFFGVNAHLEKQGKKIGTKSQY